MNAGARDLADAVVAAVAGSISVTDAIPSRLSSLPRSSDSGNDGDEATHMLLYLNRSTWAGDGAEALAEQVRAARRARLPIVMAHENDAVRGGCIFGHFFEVTPRDLIADGLYDSLAVGCYTGPHRHVSIALLAKALGASRQQGVSSLVRLASSRSSSVGVRVASSRSSSAGSLGVHRTSATAEQVTGDDQEAAAPPSLSTAADAEVPPSNRV